MTVRLKTTSRNSSMLCFPKGKADASRTMKSFPRRWLPNRFIRCVANIRPTCFERLENHGTIETKDVYTHLDNKVYTIEHIMPQHLTPAWTRALGPNSAEIHSTWLHRLANLTLSGYNPNLSNKTFAEKRDAAEGGYKASGLKMNQRIAQKETWGLAELEERNRELAVLALKDMAVPAKWLRACHKGFLISVRWMMKTSILREEALRKYSLQNVEQPVSSWSSMFEQVVKFLHEKDKSVLFELVHAPDEDSALSAILSGTEDGMRVPLKIDDGIYVEKNTSTAYKISLLRRLFARYEMNPADLVFYLKDADSADS